MVPASRGISLRLIRFLVLAIPQVSCGCAGPPVLKRQMLGYDEITSTLDEQLLLLNIARARYYF
jgi:hypothetical protein